jgi:Ca2+-dependent lipid-binding protein
MGETKTTDYKKATASPIFNEQLFYEFTGKSIDDLETGMIKIRLMDHDFIGSNNLLGTFTVDVSFIYKMNTDHELYRMWVAMTDPNDETQAINAFLKISINVLGPGDKPPVHDPSKGLKDKEDSGVTKLFTPGRVKMAGHIVKICIYRCEHLAPLDFESIGVDPSLDPYVKVSFAGSKAVSKYIKKNRNPEFN